MRKMRGPCYHCGIDHSPLWRHGPEDKPVLCNACGSRYRIWGNLEEYLPKHFQPHHVNNLQNLNLQNKPPNQDPVVEDACSMWQPPSKKRSKVTYKKLTPMKRFERQLRNLWKQQRSNESSSEEILLYNMNNFIPSDEIGLGVVPLKKARH